MSGIEVVGLLASASQLVVYSIKITTSLSEICQRIQDAPLRISQHSDQIRHLVSAAQLVQQHHLLQTAHVHAQINATLEQAKSLSEILEQLTIDYTHGSIRRYWKILKASKEKQILANFDRLEKEKSALILCISVVHTDLLGKIPGIYKETMAGTKKESWINLDVEEEEEEEESKVAQIPTEHITANEGRTIPEVRRKKGSHNVEANSNQRQRGQVPSEEMAQESHSSSSRPQVAPGQSRESPNRETHHVYDNITTGTSTQVMNGDALSKDFTTVSPKHLYKNISVGSKSQLLNGNVSGLDYFQAFFGARNDRDPYDLTQRGSLFYKGLWLVEKAS